MTISTKNFVRRLSDRNQRRRRKSKSFSLDKLQCCERHLRFVSSVVKDVWKLLSFFLAVSFVANCFYVGLNYYKYSYPTLLNRNIRMKYLIFNNSYLGES